MNLLHIRPTIKNYKIQSGIIIWLLFLMQVAEAQLPFPTNSGDSFLPNPSFEGSGGENVPPPYWIPCNNFSTPDRQPNQVDVHLPPSDGEAYISMRVRGNYPPSHVNTREHVYSQLIKPLQQGICYTMSVDLAYDDMAIYFGALTPSYPTVFRVWGSDGCDTTELLAISPLVENTRWETFTLLFTPEEDSYDFIYIEPYYAADSIYHGLLLVDNIRIVSSLDQNTIVMDTLVWPGTEIRLTASEGENYQWYSNPGLTCYDCQNPYIIADSDQVYTVRLINKDMCPEQESFIVNILTCEMIHPESSIIKLDTTIKDFATIDLRASAGYEYAWSKEAVLSCNDCRNPNATIDRSVILTCTLTDDHNCSYQEIFRIYMELSYTNVITPNGDGKNELFIVKGLPEYTSLSIFDRNGVLVYETTNYQNNWRGRDQHGNLLPEDTYWFILSEPDLNIYVKDFILIKRN